MKSKYRKNRRILIASAVVVLALAAIIGTVAFVKSRQDVSATTANSVDANNGNATTRDNQNSSNLPDGSSEVTNGENQTIPTTETTETNTTTGNTANGTGTGTGTGTRRTTGGTNRNLPDTEYTQTEERERKVSDSFYASWTPLDVNASTEEISNPKIEIHKMSYINDETENDQAIHSVVFKKDYITYKISAKNNGTDKLNNIYIYDNVPEGTELVEVYDEGVENNGRLTWIKSIDVGEEIIVSFKVRVIFGEDTKGKEIRQIDNKAIVNGKDTEPTHNPTIVAEKEVKVISANGEELNNQIVTPGTRLRYYVNLTNSTEYDGTTKVTDMIPEGTSLINNTISDNGVLGENNTITWNGVKVLAGETVKVSFDVTVNKGTRSTVSNVALVGSDKPEDPENPEEPEEPTTTNEVKTPIFTASKTSTLDGEKVRETGKVEYVVTITNTANPENEDEKGLTGVAKLEDKFWKQDLEKMTFESGVLEITSANKEKPNSSKEIDEDFLGNIDVELKAGETARIIYTYIVNEMTLDKPDEGILSDDIANNLYWATPENEDPSRPDNPNDETEYKNPENPDDPTPPEPDPDDELEEDPIDTVKVNVEEKYIKVEANKKWIDANNRFGTRPENIIYTLYQNGSKYMTEENQEYSITVTADDNWKATFIKLKESDPDGRKYTYTVQEADVINYKTTYSNDGLTVTNKYTNPDVTAEKKVQVVTKTQDGSVTANSLIDNRIVEPGTRLRYTITITNDNAVDAYVNIEDEVPAGTTLYNNVISDQGKLSDGIVKWIDIKVGANSEKEVYFDVTVDKDTKDTVKNVATVKIPQIPEDPENPEPDKEIPTNEVKTPVFTASKTSTLDGEKVRETGKVEYVVTITNSANPDDEDEKGLTGVAKLEDKFWEQDLEKMTFESGVLEIISANKEKPSSSENIDEDFLGNIDVELKAGETARIIYTYIVNEMALNKPDDGIISDEIANNLYWAEVDIEDPDRPVNPNDDGTYERRDPEDPTQPEADPDLSEKPGLIDTVKVTVEEKYIKVDANKKWIDADNKFGTRPENITYTLYQNGSKYMTEENQEYSITVTADDNWKATFVKLKETDPNGRKYTYTVQEDAVLNYETTYSNDGLTVKNRYTNPDVTAEKKVQVVTKTQDGKVTANSLIGNRIIEPGTRLRYTITITNDNAVDAYVNIEDEVPAGTTLYNNVISDQGKLSDGIVKWIDIKVGANSEKEVYFDVTVDKDTKDTVKNVATVKIPQIPEDPENPEPDKEIPTNEVKTPVFVASKTSTLDGEKVHEGGEVEYVVTITNSANPNDQEEKGLPGVAKLEDKFWEQDSGKMTFKTGTLTITDANGRTVGSPRTIDESFLRNIEVELKAGQKATIKYTYIVNAFTSEIPDTGIRTDELANNLYWAEAAINDPDRPVNPNDDGTYERRDPDDPTQPEADPDLSEKPGLIDTVIVKIEEPIFTAEKVIVKAKGAANEQEVKELAVKEKEEINYRITVKNIGNVQGTTAILDKFENTDNTKVTFKTGSATIKYYNKISDTTPYERETLTENTLKNNKIVLTINGGGKAVIEYAYTANVINKDKTPDSDGVIRESVTNNLYWSKVNNSDSNDPRYPTTTPIDETVVTLEKVYIEQIATKVWDDNNNTNSKRPTSVTFTLKSSDNKITKTITLKAEDKEYTSENYVVKKVDNNQWQVTFKMLPKFDANGNNVTYTVEEATVANYETRYSTASNGNITVKNILKENITGKVETTGIIEAAPPLDVVFVLDLSASMLDNGTTGKKNYTNNRATSMVDAVNKAITEIMKNSNNRVAVETFNSGTKDLLALGHYTPKTTTSGVGEYLKYTNISTTSTSSNHYRVGNIQVNVKGASGNAYIYDNGTVDVMKEQYRTGTYTQGGVYEGSKLFKGNKTTTENNRVPIMILVTDGDPTFYDTDYASPKTTLIDNMKDNDSSTYAPGGYLPGKGVLRFVNNNYYYYTMRTIISSKSTVSGKYKDQTARFYTIGMYMDGSMADALLNLTKTNIGYLHNTTNINEDIHGDNSNTATQRRQYYINQANKLYNQLWKNGKPTLSNYVTNNGAFRVKGSSTTLTELNNSFNSIIEQESYSSSNINIQGDSVRKIDLTDIKENKAFTMTITGKDFDGNNISVNISSSTFTAAKATANGIKYIKGTIGNYYVDLSNVRSGTVNISYGK